MSFSSRDTHRSGVVIYRSEETFRAEETTESLPDKRSGLHCTPICVWIIYCILLLAMIIVMIVLYFQLHGQITILAHELNKTNTVISNHQVQLTNLKENIKQTQKNLRNARHTGQSCPKISENGMINNGVYNITAGGRPFFAYCDMEDGGYVVFQRRFDGSTNFNQNYQTYVDGFGNLTGEYWLGLENMHQYTKSGRHRLRIDLEAYDGTTAYALYENFKIGPGPEYKLNIGAYSGTAGDSLRYHHDMQFSAVDHDVDQDTAVNCADQSQGAFWYNSCLDVNINAFVYNDTNPNTGMVWSTFNFGDPNKATAMFVLRM